MGGWDSHIDHDFFVRAYSDCLVSRRYLVTRYRTSNDNTRIFKIQGTPYKVTITRGSTTFSHTLNVPEHTMIYQDEVSTPDIVCMALTCDGFILVPDDIDSPTLF